LIDTKDSKKAAVIFEKFANYCIWLWIFPNVLQKYKGWWE